MGADEEEALFLLESIFPVFEIFFGFSLTKGILTVESAVEDELSVELGLLPSD